MWDKLILKLDIEPETVPLVVNPKPVIFPVVYPKAAISDANIKYWFFTLLPTTVVVLYGTPVLPLIVVAVPVLIVADELIATIACAVKLTGEPLQTAEGVALTELIIGLAVTTNVATEVFVQPLPVATTVICSPALVPAFLK